MTTAMASEQREKGPVLDIQAPKTHWKDEDGYEYIPFGPSFLMHGFFDYVNQNSYRRSEQEKIDLTRKLTWLLVVYQRSSVSGTQNRSNELADQFCQNYTKQITENDYNFLYGAFADAHSTLMSERFQDIRNTGFFNDLAGAYIDGALSLFSKSPKFPKGADIIKLIGAASAVDSAPGHKDKSLEIAYRVVIHKFKTEENFRNLVRAVTSERNISLGDLNFNFTAEQIKNQQSPAVTNLLNQFSNLQQRPSSQQTEESILQHLNTYFSALVNDRERLKQTYDTTKEVISFGTLLIQDFGNANSASVFNLSANVVCDILYATGQFFAGEIGPTKLAFVATKCLYSIGRVIFGWGDNSLKSITDTYFEQLDEELKKINKGQADVIKGIREIIGLIRAGQEEVIQKLSEMQNNILTNMQEESKFIQQTKVEKALDRILLMLQAKAEQFSPTFFDHYVISLYSYGQRISKLPSFSGYSEKVYSDKELFSIIQTKPRIDLIYGLINQIIKNCGMQSDVALSSFFQGTESMLLIANPIEWRRGAMLFLGAVTEAMFKTNTLDLTRYCEHLLSLQITGRETKNTTRKALSQKSLNQFMTNFVKEVEKFTAVLDDAFIEKFKAYTFSKLTSKQPHLKNVPQAILYEGHDQTILTITYVLNESIQNKVPIGSNEYFFPIFQNIRTVNKYYFIDSLSHYDNHGKPVAEFHLFNLNRDILSFLNNLQSIGLITMGEPQTTSGELQDHVLEIRRYQIKFIAGYLAGLEFTMKETIHKSNYIGRVLGSYFEIVNWRQKLRSFCNDDLQKLKTFVPEHLATDYTFKSVTIFDFLHMQMHFYYVFLRKQITPSDLTDFDLVDNEINKTSLIPFAMYARILLQLKYLCGKDDLAIEDFLLPKITEVYSRSAVLEIMLEGFVGYNYKYRCDTAALPSSSQYNTATANKSWRSCYSIDLRETLSASKVQTFHALVRYFSLPLQKLEQDANDNQEFKFPFIDEPQQLLKILLNIIKQNRNDLLQKQLAHVHSPQN